MNIVDILIIIFILIGGLIGFKRGAIRSAVSFVGLIIIIGLSYLLKNPVADFLCNHLPFFEFKGLIKGISVINIALYELIAFIGVLVILMIVFKAVIFISNGIEGVLKATIILAIPSKIIGGIIGLIENTVFVFIVLYILQFPMFAPIEQINNSKFANIILNNTPLLSNIADNTVKMAKKFEKQKEKYKDNSISSDEFNLETLDLFLEYKIVTYKTVNKLVENKKLNIKGIETVTNKYKEE